MALIQFLTAIASVPANEIWRFAVDGKFHTSEKGPDSFESREPGCIEGISNGLIKAIELTHQPLTTKMIRDIHFECMTPLVNQERADPGQYRKVTVSSIIQHTYYSMQGYTQFLLDSSSRGYILFSELMNVNGKIVKANEVSSAEKAKNKVFLFKQANVLTISNLYREFPNLKAETVNNDVGLAFRPAAIAEIADEMEKIVAGYNSKIATCKHDDAKLMTMVETIKDFLLLHPFRDGNNRTFVNCLLNKMLIEQFSESQYLQNPIFLNFIQRMKS